MISKDDIKLIAKTYDKESNMIVAMEECAELTQAISKVIRKSNNETVFVNLIEEIADVIICIEIIKQSLHIRDVEIESMIENKMKRNLSRIKVKENYAYREIRKYK